MPIFFIEILKAENNIKEIPNPKPLTGMNDRIEFKDISFSYKDILFYENCYICKP